MKESVIIKSYKNGLAVYLDAEIPFSQLCERVGEKFRDSARFFGDMRVALSFEGRSLLPEEENCLVDTISQNSALQILCVVGKDERQQQTLESAAAVAQHNLSNAESAGQFYRGNIKNGQILKMDGSIIVVGDVDPGCSVMASRDIIILGRLAGNACAGGDGQVGHFIAALEMTPQKVTIGDFKYKTKEKFKWPLGAKKGQPGIALVQDGKIRMRAITNELLNELPF